MKYYCVYSKRDGKTRNWTKGMEIDVTITLLASNVVNGVVIFGRNGTSVLFIYWEKNP